MPGVSQYLPRLTPVDLDGVRQRIADLLEQADQDPGSAPYDVAALEAVAAWLATMSDKHDEQPERETYLNWLALRAREHGGTWAEAVLFQDDELPTCDQSERIAWQWMRLHAAAPFLVGRRCPELGPGMPAETAHALMPLEGAEYAFAVDPMGERGGGLLFMAKPVRERYLSGGEWIDEADEWRMTFVPDGARVEVVPVPKRSISRARQTEARRWWREVNGLPAGAGRHAGVAYWTVERILDAMMAYRDTHGEVPRNREEFVEWAHHRHGMETAVGGLRTVGKRWSKQLEMPYSTIRDEIAKPTGIVLKVDTEPE